MFKTKRVLWMSALCLVISTDVLSSSLPDVEFSAAGGFNWVNSNNNNLYVSSYETDSNKVTHVSNNAFWKVGVGYYVLNDYLQDRSFLNSLLTELNFYHSSATVKGDVWQYQLPQFNNYNFRTPITSRRLMLDFKPTLFTFYHFSPYFVLGAGIAWNATSYQQSITAANIDPTSYISLGKRTNTNMAYDAGFGVKGDITSHLSASVEYLYTQMGKVTPSALSQGVTTVMKAPTFTVRSQAVLFGLSWKM